jgi:hypothetical protein
MHPARAKLLAAFAAAVWGLAHPGVLHAGWIADAGVETFYESNVGLAQKARDIKSDVALASAASGGLAVSLGDRNLASLTADVSGTGYERLRGLSNVTLGGTAAFRSKFGLGADAPWARVSASVARLDYDYDLRDGWRYRIGAGVGKRLAARWDVRAEYTYERRFADEDQAVVRTLPGDVYDQTSHTGAVRTDVTLTEALALTAGYSVRGGDVTSTTHRDPAIFAASTALANDRALGRDFFAYKIDATTHVLSAGISYAVGRSASVNLGYEHSIGLAHHGLEYHDNVVRLGLLYTY